MNFYLRLEGWGIGSLWNFKMCNIQSESDGSLVLKKLR